MRVVLKNDWFAPNGELFRKDAGGTDIPDAFEAQLPKSAKRVGAKREPLPVPKSDSLKDHDPERAAAEAEAKAAEEAEKTRQANAKAIREQMLKEGKAK